ncbi:MAG: hypothetical protein ACXVEC_08970 [Nocardioides sp.]
MYARSITYHGEAQRQDDGIAFVRDEVMPMITRLAGCVGLSMVVDRDTGASIVTSAWNSREAMLASNEALVASRARGGEILGSQPRIEEWEVAVMHRRHVVRAAAWCRLTWLRVNQGEVDRGIGLYRDAMVPEMESLDGFCSASLMVNRETGRACNTTVYDSHEAMAASRDRSWAIRDAGVRDAGVDVLDVAECEVALAHLRLPEHV